jgi:hypothetical protein
MGALLDLALKAARSSEEGAEMIAITEWLDQIGERDPVIREHLLRQCRDDPAARAYFLRHARGEFIH